LLHLLRPLLWEARMTPWSVTSLALHPDRKKHLIADRIVDKIVLGEAVSPIAVKMYAKGLWGCWDWNEPS
jgi:hypothetical protein